jgi:hypothetical protein
VGDNGSTELGRARATHVGWSERALIRLLEGPGSDEPGNVSRVFDAFARILLLALATEAWAALRLLAFQEAPALHASLALIFSVSCVVGFTRKGLRPALAASGVALVVTMTVTFPFNANHQFLCLFASVFLLLPRTGDVAQQQVALQGLRWLLLIGFFWAGLQKVFYGYYFGGEFLAHRISVDPAFGQIFQWLMPGAELERLVSLGGGEGAGPYRVDSSLFIGVSNLSYLAELILPPLLLIPRTRFFAALAAIAFVVTIELGAREIMFGALMIAFLLLFFPGRWLPRALPVFVSFYLYVLSMVFGLLPRWEFG